MKNLSIGDIKSLTEKIKIELLITEKSYREQAFKIYDASEMIKTLIRDVENFKDVDYTFDEFGDFLAFFDCSNEILGLPFIDDYFSKNHPMIYVGRGHLKGFLTVHLCPPITVNWNHDRNEYFMYDHDAGQPIIEKSSDLDDNEELIFLALERYMRKTGIFPDIISIYGDGSYRCHIDTKMGSMTDDEINHRYNEILNQGMNNEEEEA